MLLDMMPASFGYLIDERRDVIAHAAFTISAIDAAPIIASPHFHVVRLERVQRDGESLVRVDFEFKPNEPKKWDNMAGWMLMEPERHWSIREYEVRRTSILIPEHTIIATGKVRYSSGAGGAVLPEDVVMVFRESDKGKPTSARRTRFKAEQCTGEFIPAAEFTLAGYGLGDVVLPKHGKASHLTQWAFGIAVVAIVLGVALRWLEGWLSRKSSGVA